MHSTCLFSLNRLSFEGQNTCMYFDSRATQPKTRGPRTRLQHAEYQACPSFKDCCGCPGIRPQVYKTLPHPIFFRSLHPSSNTTSYFPLPLASRAFQGNTTTHTHTYPHLYSHAFPDHCRFLPRPGFHGCRSEHDDSWRQLRDLSCQRRPECWKL